MFEYMDEIDKALRLPRNGDVITGEVIQVSDKDVIVNIGCKKDGIIPRSEVTLEEGQSLNDVFHEGDEIQAKVLKTDDGDGNILMSKKRVIVSEHWEDINRALEDKETLEVTIVREVNGGVIANFEEISGFIPMSQLSDRYVETATEFVGQTVSAKVMRVDQKRNKVVFSHKAVLAEERQKRMLEIWDTISVGDIIKGKVMRFTDYGAFVDIGGIDGLLHISEISWGKLRHPDEMLALDQEIDVKVLSMNKDKEKISLSYKQNLPEPWAIINDKYTVGQVISGKAVQLKEYGVFVELEPGLDGLVHISEIAFKRVNNISDEIEVGQDITAKILEIDRERRRISLSIKETLEKPDDEDLEDDVAVEADVADSADTGADADVASEASIDVVEADLQAPDPEAEPAIEAEDAAEVFEDAVQEAGDADLEIPNPDATPVESAEDAAEVFEEAGEAEGDADLEIPDPDAKPVELAEDAAVDFEEAPEVFEDTSEPTEEPAEEAVEEKEESAE
jgi:4-hydroxy-3-methylbut-2-enyl diphosphate reductase